MTTPSPGSPAAGKGRPTPKRSQSQRSRRGGPVTPPPQTRKEAAQRAKLEAKQARARVRDGSQLLPRDAGPVRAMVRDVVDRRRSIGPLMLPLAALLVLAQLANNRRLLDVALLIWMVGIVALVVDLVLTARVLRRRLKAEHPEVTRRRSDISYGLLRSTVFRRWRMPQPRVSPGPLRG